MNEPFHPMFVPSLPADLLGRVGEAVAAAAAALQRETDAARLAAGLAALEDTGLQLQQAARVLSAPAGERLERVALGVAALQACSEWAPALARAGVAWAGPRQDARVLANPAELKQMIDLAFGHAIGLGRRIEVDVDHRDAPPRTLLRVAVLRGDGEMFTARPGEAGEWHWALLSLLARHAGVGAERDVQAAAVVMTLAFEPFGEPLPEPLAPARLPESHLPPGCRVLLLEPHEATRLHAERLMAGAALRVVAVATPDQARGSAARALPDCLVTGIDTREPACAALVADLRARVPGLRVVELSAEPWAFETSLPEAGRPARVPRDDLERCLVPALAQELSAPR